MEPLSSHRPSLLMLVRGESFRYDATGFGRGSRSGSRDLSSHLCSPDRMRAQQLASASHRELYYALQVGLEIDISLHTYRVAYCTDLLALMYRVYDDKARGGESSTGAHLKMPRLTLYDLEPSSNQGRLWHQMWTSELLHRPPFQRSYDSVLVIRFDMAFWKPAKLGAEMQKLAIFLDSSGADSVYFSFPWVPGAIHSHAEAKEMLARNESAPEATTTTTLLRQWPVGQWDFLVLCPAYARHASGRRPYVNDELQFVPHLTLHIARVLSVFPEHWATDCLTLASLQVRFLEDQPADSNPAVCKNAIYYCTDRFISRESCSPAPMAHFKRACCHFGRDSATGRLIFNDTLPLLSVRHALAEHRGPSVLRRSDIWCPTTIHAAAYQQASKRRAVAYQQMLGTEWRGRRRTLSINKSVVSSITR